MIVSNNISPEKNLYYLGSEIISILNQYKESIDLIDLYNLLDEKVKISFVLYTYALDWLFISGVIINDKKGQIKKCI